LEVGITGHNFGRGPFHQSLVQIGPVASEELIKNGRTDGRTTDDRRRTLSDDNSSPDPLGGSGELRKLLKVSNLACQPYLHIFPLKLPLGQFPPKIPGPVSQTKLKKIYGGDAVLTKKCF
jgi:hypothetical protein